MIKLITPPGMLVTVSLLVVYSVYAFLVGSIEKSPILTAGAGVALLASYGTAMLRPWSRYLVYILILGFIGKLGSSIVAAVKAGFFEFQFGSTGEMLWSLAPSILMTLLSIWCGLIVHRHFARGSTIAQDTVGLPLGAQVSDAKESGLPPSSNKEERSPVR